jgi:2-polyprenyl-6-hydroxyphenyl methylase/3-demethylubiquinone-9 3-methyltransferase
LFYIAIYEKNDKSEYWIAQKKKYNRSSRFKKRIMETQYVWKNYFRTTSIKRIIGSLRYIKNYKKSRGMEFWTDVRDWLGGWPYEPAASEEVCQFCEEELGLKKIKIKTGEANIEYLFERPKN